MKNKKTLKRSLSAVLCVAMLFNPVMTANASQHPGGIPRSPEITEEYLADKIPVYINIWETNVSTEPDGSQFVGHCPYYMFRAHVSVSIFTAGEGEHELVKTTDLGEFYTGTETSLIVGLPEEVRNKYGDRSKYTVTVNVTPVDLHDDKTLVDVDSLKAIDDFCFEYQNENEMRCDIDLYLIDKVFHTQGGVIHLKAPEKREYKIGEEFDVTGGAISGFGEIKDRNKNIIDKWKLDERTLTADDLDTSQFDNTRPGEYLISVKPINMDTSDCNKFTDNTVYDSFYVTVVDDDTNKVSAVHGDANEDGTVDISDAILIMQSLSNPSVYGENGSAPSHITTNGIKNGDVTGNGDGITNSDALNIQKYLLKLIDSLS